MSEQSQMLERIHTELVRMNYVADEDRRQKRGLVSEQELLQTIVYQNRQQIGMLQYIAAAMTICMLKLFGVL